MSRLPLIVGNWKMNLTHIDTIGMIQKLVWSLSDRGWRPEKSECVIIPPFTALRTTQTMVEGDRLEIRYGAQDISPFADGAYTGDISATMLTKLGCTYVIVGHSERRTYHGETDQIVCAKATNALANGLVPIICVGEDIAVRRDGKHIEFTTSQLRAALEGMTGEQVAGLVVAYEPIWAIGTGEIATPADAQEVCGALRSTVSELYGDAVAQSTRILYGGSVKASNVVSIMEGADIDGALVGGASLNPEEFSAITRYYDMPAL